MPEYSLVPVEHQPDFENASLVPVDHDPFGADGLSLPAGPQLEGRSQIAATGTAPPTVSAPIADTPAVVGESDNRGSAVADAPSRTATENPTPAPISPAPPNFSSGRAWGDVGAAMPEAYGAQAPIMDPLARALLSTATLPQRAMDASRESFAHRYRPPPSTISDSDVWADPLIPIAAETAMMTMGTGAIASAPIRSGEVLLGAGPVRRPLAMDLESRLGRANDMGFFTEMPLYHGSGNAFDAIRSVPTDAPGRVLPGVSLSSNPEIASEFAAKAEGRGLGDNPQVYKLLHRAENPARLKWSKEDSFEAVSATIRDAFDRGHDAVIIHNYTTAGGKTGDVLIVRDGNQLRSVNAAFDPAKRDSNNLLYGLGGAATAPLSLIDQDGEGGGGK